MSELTMKARPLLHYAPVPGGVYVSGPRSQLLLRGSDLLFRVADACIPRLEAGATEDELVAALGSERARLLVRHLTDGLRSHGMLLDPRRTVAAPPPQARERHPESVAYLESVSADPYAAFAAVRAAKVALWGPAEAVRPAERGLVRAGVGTVVVVDGPDHPDLADADAVVWCSDGDPPRVPDATTVVPVFLDARVLLVGPVGTGRDGHATWAALAERALDWTRADAPDPAARPVADALAGALAARLLFTVLAGEAAAGTAYVVHGGALVAQELTVAADPAPGPADGAWCPLDGVESTPMPEPAEALEAAAALSARWTGLYAPGGTEEDLPQLPLSLREIEYRTGGSGSVFAWGADQRVATVGIALEALRRLPRDAPAGAAGLTAEHWLLDGALRLLAADARPLTRVAPTDLGPESYRLWSSFTGLHPEPGPVTLAHVPGIEWRLATVEGPDGPLGAAWGPDADAAVRDALSTAIAGTLVRRLRPDSEGPALCTDALVFAGDATIGALRKQITAHAVSEGLAYRGRPRGADPVLGDLAFRSGPVEAVSVRARPVTVEQESVDAH